MKLALLPFLFAACSFNCLAGDYQLKWQDNFDGSALDESRNWSIEVNGDGGGNSELQYYRRENISIGKEPVTGENCLIITGKKESYLGKTCTSGRLTTQNKMTFQYGKLEARIKLPKTANGLWPAFWLLGTNISTVGWPKCGETDILEMGNANGITNGIQDKYFNGACHWGYYVNNSYPNYAKATTSAYSLQDDFHLFTLIWDAQSVKMYLDLDKYPSASPYYEMDITLKTTDRDPYYYFNKPFFVIFNLAIGGNFTQIWDINKITALTGGDANMYIDYIRLYQKGDTGESFTGIQTALNGTSSGTIQLVPNPSKNEVRISGIEKPFKITVYNANGAPMEDLSDAEWIDTSKFPMGAYYLRITNSIGKIETKKFIKE
jgi:Beta-glucanase/Beta-glucan synthetase